jgi:hypothetical protein
MTNEEKITKFLKGRHIPSGIGTIDAPCSIAAINLALLEIRRARPRDPLS